jgi:predicted Zn-dependent protease
VNPYSVEKERALGEHYASEIRKQSEAFGDPSVQTYVDRVGRELLSGLKMSGWNISLS